MAGAAHVALRRRAQIIHAAHPHAGMAGIHDHNRIVGHVSAQFAADARRMDRHGVRFKHRLVLGVPVGAQRGDFLDPGCALHGARLVDLTEHANKHALGVAQHARLQRIIAAQGFRLDVDLDGRRADARRRPEMRRHAAGLAADEADEIGAVHCAICGFPRIGADHPDRKWVHARDNVFAIERGRDRNLQRFGKRNELLARARSARAAARDDDRPLGFLQQFERGLHMRRFRFRAKRRNARKLRLNQPVHLSLFQIDLPFVAAKLQVHRTRRAGCGRAKRLSDHVGNARDVVDGDVHLRHRLERRHIVDLLINLAELGLRVAPARHRDHRGMRQIGIAQARGEIECTDHLRHADARLAGGARIAVSHVRRGFFAVTMDARDLRPALHLGESSPQDRRHHEDMSYAVACQHVGEHFGADAPGIVSNCRHAQAGSNFSATPLMQ